jgi:hypothetical protein
MPHANTAVDVLADVSTRLPEDTPPFSVVAHITIPSPAKGMIIDLMEKRCVILDVCMNKNGIVKQKARKNPIILS